MMLPWLLNLLSVKTYQFVKSINVKGRGEDTRLLDRDEL